MRSSAAAILTVDDRYVLQLRDDSTAIAFPGHWGLFGGEVKETESPFEAIRREVNEELSLDVPEWREFRTVPYSSVLSGAHSLCAVFAADITDLWPTHVLREGQATGAFQIKELPAPMIPLALELLTRYHAMRAGRVSHERSE